ncbi:MAG: glutamyl-tRNA reductase [Zetaproteobacteria bacterium CG_4_9_14_3_um_filter_49_83]|nr:MAG: glutamyl-tRNA reductase [Zetaproteobacteria bacterium CG1_02_49_23]PIQ30650.1 MAG: glutamyl-tRNA reductase [Zetaproteobacteria bacterium CG17_big_fil_post_rev_8_21_14_2_50_50_13]PIV30202.1 MAG: glutamyl-tRNA reductase [Zetaproteobacteria bacterium CG02_land_8_20_14_3_00_50_9]PIY55112.1 MAG: glutamyl-tRNA reductase [Zetaproteobacteria bacterium CG_4_10_14_0_8_um_filter_49_80]PJA35289.1 MAG: glutamyl-tRNA reductase [Zetaproteobacteria bacterium CG_4_9_14_3_um_filter_49_83]
MRICHVGLNHKTAPVELRERLAVAADQIPGILNGLTAQSPVREAAILSTCNRVEVTVVTHDPDAAIAAVHQWFASKAVMDIEEVTPYLYSHTTQKAIRHIYAVASGLDSLVLGEPQILGQVKASYEQALSAGTAGHILHRLYQSTFAAAKRARSETSIGHQSVNISSCAVELAKRIFGNLAGKTVMLIGAGEMAELAARHLRGNGCTDILVANRTLERAQKLAVEFEGHALTLEQLPDYLDAADIIISSTGANTYVLLPSMMEKAMKKRNGKPVFLVDIAVPRDIDPRLSDISSVYLYDIDDLQQVVQGNMQNREAASRQASEILAEEESSFLNWLKSLESVPLIRCIQQQTDAMRTEELEKAARYLKDFDQNQMEAVERLSKALMKRFLHSTLRTLKKLPDDMEGDLLMGAARKLFDAETRIVSSTHKDANERTSG